MSHPWGRPQSGIWIDRPLYSAASKELAMDLIEHTRRSIVLPEEALKDLRFKDSADVFARLESMVSEDDFLHEPCFSIERALVDAAKADYWYAHEKSWTAPEDDCCYGTCGDERESDAC